MTLDDKYLIDHIATQTSLHGVMSNGQQYSMSIAKVYLLR